MSKNVQNYRILAVFHHIFYNFASIESYMTPIRYLHLIILWLLLGMESHAGAVPGISFSYLTPEGGLSQITVNSLYMDENDELWIATREGLNHFNGNRISVFKKEKDHPYSLPSNSIERITGDGHGRLFLLCTEGVACMNLRTRRFRTIVSDDISAIAFHKNLYVAVGNRIYRFDDSLAKRTLCRMLDKGRTATDLFFDSRGRMWVGTDVGALVFPPHVSAVRPTPPLRRIGQGRVTSFFEDSHRGVWIGTWEEGYYHVGPQGRVHNSRSPGSSIPSNFVRTFCEDHQGNIWIGTFRGLSVYNPQTRQTRVLTADGKEGSLSNASVWSLVCDRQGTVWVGTYFGGVNYFNAGYNIYQLYRTSDESTKGLSSPIVGRMTEDDEGHLWICTEGGGLDMLDHQTGRFQWFRFGESGLSQNNLKALWYDRRRKCLWIGTHLGGLDRMDIHTHRVTVFRHRPGDPSSLPSDIVRDIRPWGHRLVLATQQGVCLFDPHTGSCRRLFADTRLGRLIQLVSSVAVDGKGQLWIGTERAGVFCFSPRHKRLICYRHHPSDWRSLSNNHVNNIYVDPRGRIWVSTAGGGLDLWHAQESRFENFDAQNAHLASNCVYGVHASTLNARNLLLITNEGFSVLDIHARTCRNYGRVNGFPLATINENGLYVGPQGTVWLGGVQGMLSFSEKALHKPIAPYRLKFANLYLDGKPVQPLDSTGILDATLEFTKTLKLSSDQSSFAIEIATSNYLKSNHDELQYRLVGSSAKWTAVQLGQTLLNFNLKPGHYTLELRSLRPDIPESQLNIQVLPPWYASWWAKLIWTLLLISAIVYMAREYRERVKLNASLSYERQHARDIVAMNESKLRFFTNISHEIRTPLTLIIGYSEMLLGSRNFPPEVYARLLDIYKGSIQLRSLISEMIDFRKQEQGKMQVHLKTANFTSFVNETFLLFREYAQSKGISMYFEHDEADIFCAFDATQMQKVLNNLMANALKHTPQGGTVTVGLHCHVPDKPLDGKPAATLTVADTGEGIPAKDIDRIFDRFYQADRSDSISSGLGTGIGLALTKGIVELHQGTIRVESEEGKGSRFIVTLAAEDAPHTAVGPVATHPDRGAAAQWKPAPALPNNSRTAGEAPLADGKEQRPAILIVEDNDDLRSMLARVFAPFYRITTAIDGVEALDDLHNEEADIVVTDVLMPRMTGIELCRAIKADFSICHIPVVLLTAQTATEQALEGLRTGADDYITKPFNTDILVSRCNNLVNTRRMLQRKFSEHPHTQADLLATNPLDKQLVDKAMRVIDDHITDSDFNVDVFAQEVGLSRTSLFTKWKSLTGQTPKSFLLNIRLRKAAAMLHSEQGKSVEAVALDCGFSTGRYFCKCFKEHYKVSPSAYRKGHQPEAGNSPSPEATGSRENHS